MLEEMDSVLDLSGVGVEMGTQCLVRTVELANREWVSPVRTRLGASGWETEDSQPNDRGHSVAHLTSTIKSLQQSSCFRHSMLHWQSLLH